MRPNPRRTLLFALALAAAAGAAGCSSGTAAADDDATVDVPVPSDPGDGDVPGPRDDSTATDEATATDETTAPDDGPQDPGPLDPGPLPPVRVDKVDLLIAVDNSRFMGDGQDLLALVVTDLVQALVNPPCVDAAKLPVAGQPASGADPCPEGSARVAQPVTDLHVGIVTSSLGGHGSDTCTAANLAQCPPGATNVSYDDRGHLVDRSDPCGGTPVPTYLDRGFLAWDPAHQATPPGESDAGALATAVGALVRGAGQLGCGFESQLESWYRFLVDPEPYESIAAVDNKAVLTGVDQALLAQRKAFLRPDSLLAVLMISDENDCSTKEYGQFYLANQQRMPGNPNQVFHLPRPRSECATNPNDPCCRSCGQNQEGCPADPACAQMLLDDTTDPLNLRCWDQKRRFGIDFLYPVDRYVQGLTAPSVPKRDGEPVPNPVFTNLDPAAWPDAKVRDPGLVVVGGIVGVPWQDLARDPHDLTKGYKGPDELAVATDGHTTWDHVLGDPATYTPPLDPHMVEANAPRSGTNLITGDTTAPPAQVAGGPDPINGHEYTPGTRNGVQVVADDLEYACTFPLPAPRDCTNPGIVCACQDPLNDDPLCEADPASGTRTIQVYGKAYPGLRQLQLLRDLGTQGVAASICAAQVTDPTRADYAYRPAVNALVGRMRDRLKQP